MSLPPTRIPTCLTLEPIPDESLICYVFRLARFRHLSSAYAQWTDCGLQNFSNQPSLEGLAALAESASMDVDRLKAISHGPPDRVGAVVLGRRVRQSVVEDRGKAHRRICPACLSEAAYHRAMWDLWYVAVCPVHRCVLVDTCSACARPLKWVGADLTRCQWGQRLDLDGVEPEPVAPQDVEPTAAVFGLFGDVRFQEEAEAVRNILPLSDVRARKWRSSCSGWVWSGWDGSRRSSRPKTWASWLGRRTSSCGAAWKRWNPGPTSSTARWTTCASGGVPIP